MDFKNGKHSISATFFGSQNVDEVMNALKNAGITDVTVDKIERFNVGTVREDNREGAENLEKTISQAEEVLLASDPSLSEFGLEKEGVSEKEAFNLTIEANTSKLNQALKIVEKYGGEV